jgi:hypothetical protein
MRRFTKSSTRRAALAAAVLALSLGARRAEAAAEWVYRPLTLPRGDVALDFGFGYGHAPFGSGSVSGFGLNVEVAGGITHDLELGLRTGFRLDDGGQTTQADRYGRPFDTETYGTGNQRAANPELRLRYTVARGAHVALGLEARAYLPFESGTHFGIMPAVPVIFRLGTVRIDTGIYVPILFDDPTRSFVSIPLHLWIQASPTFWLGPLTGVRLNDQNGHNAWPFGFGIGSAVARMVDLRAWFLFPDLNRNDGAARTFGLGGAVEVRFE